MFGSIETSDIYFLKMAFKSTWISFDQSVRGRLWMDFRNSSSCKGTSSSLSSLEHSHLPFTEVLPASSLFRKDVNVESLELKVKTKTLLYVRTLETDLDFLAADN
ncbi:unnamed protein product [Larinioides sclopetarius]|uniref:Uncharacterized protein n=1 Tax=Larinioides sclopetarius TaxID=280406 RepID=A0AAV2C161_9ARAC